MIQTAHFTNPWVGDLGDSPLAVGPRVEEYSPFFRFNQSPNFHGGQWPYWLAGRPLIPYPPGFVKFAKGVIVQDAFHEQTRGPNVHTTSSAESWKWIRLCSWYTSTVVWGVSALWICKYGCDSWYLSFLCERIGVNFFVYCAKHVTYTVVYKSRSIVNVLRVIKIKEKKLQWEEMLCGRVLFFTGKK